VGKILQAAGYKTWVGGNIGRPLISIVEQIEPEDVVVMELSSFQLEYFHARLNQNADLAAIPARTQRGLQTLLDNWSPPIAAVLNITPNHLDRHPSMKHYVQAKRALIDYQKKDDVLVMSLDNDMTRTIGHQFRDRVRWFSLEARMPGGAGLQNGALAFFDGNGRVMPIAGIDEIPLRGQHNISNVLAACLLAREAGGSIGAMRSVITTFKGVEHRLQYVRELNRVFFFNDSISTTPERVIAALRAFDEPVVLLAGGRDKRLPWTEAARLIHATSRHVILFGEAAGVIENALRLVESEITGARPEIHHCSNMAEAVRLAAAVASAGDVVLLSPGCASFDQFESYVERGQKFSEQVMQL
jgi:UDP-N-acetylmuramoylalanine--D-glutamate ligase